MKEHLKFKKKGIQIYDLNTDDSLQQIITDKQLLQQQKQTQNNLHLQENKFIKIQSFLQQKSLQNFDQQNIPINIDYIINANEEIVQIKPKIIEKSNNNIKNKIKLKLPKLKNKSITNRKILAPLTDFEIKNNILSQILTSRRQEKQSFYFRQQQKQISDIKYNFGEGIKLFLKQKFIDSSKYQSDCQLIRDDYQISNIIRLKIDQQFQLSNKCKFEQQIFKNTEQIFKKS